MLSIRKHGATLVGVGVGCVAGFLYWKYVGCTSGSCPITSNPTNATIYGALMGGLIINTLRKTK